MATMQEGYQQKRDGIPTRHQASRYPTVRVTPFPARHQASRYPTVMVPPLPGQTPGIQITHCHGATPSQPDTRHPDTPLSGCHPFPARHQASRYPSVRVPPLPSQTPGIQITHCQGATPSQPDTRCPDTPLSGYHPFQARHRASR